MGIGLKSVWISLRATNYSDRAFRAAIGNLKDLEKAERKHAEQMIQLREIMRFNIATGVLWAANLSIVAQGIFGLMAQTQAGAEYMEGFNETINEAKVAFADTFFETLRPALDVVKGFLDILKENAPLRMVVMLTTFAAMALIGLYAATKLVVGIKAMLALQLSVENQRRLIGIGLKIKSIIVTKAETMAQWQLAAAVAAASGGFTVAYMALSALNQPIVSAIVLIAALTAALWALYIAQSAVSLGIALVAGGVAAGAAAALAQSYTNEPQYGMGTRGLPRTGLFYGHKGEVVYNPQTDRPTGIVERGGEIPTSTVQDIDVTIEHVHTEAEFDDLDEKLARKLRDLARRA